MQVKVLMTVAKGRWLDEGPSSICLGSQVLEGLCGAKIYI